MIKKKTVILLSIICLTALCACNVPDIGSVLNNDKEGTVITAKENNNENDPAGNVATGFEEGSGNGELNSSTGDDSTIVTNAESYTRVYVMDDDEGGMYTEPYIFVNFNKDGFTIDLIFLGTGVYLLPESSGKTPTSGKAKIYDYGQENGDVGGDPHVKQIYMEYSDTQIKLYYYNVETGEPDMEYPMVFNYSNTIS